MSDEKSAVVVNIADHPGFELTRFLPRPRQAPKPPVGHETSRPTPVVDEETYRDNYYQP